MHFYHPFLKKKWNNNKNNYKCIFLGFKLKINVESKSPVWSQPTVYTFSIYLDEVTLIAPLLLWRSNNEQGWERKCVADGFLQLQFSSFGPCGFDNSAGPPHKLCYEITRKWHSLGSRQDKEEPFDVMLHVLYQNYLRVSEPLFRLFSSVSVCISLWEIFWGLCNNQWVLEHNVYKVKKRWL